MIGDDLRLAIERDEFEFSTSRKWSSRPDGSSGWRR